MQVFSYGDPSILNGSLGYRTIMAGKRKCDDCDDCNDGFCFCDEDDDEDDCDPIFCGYDGCDWDFCTCDEDDCDCHCEYDD